MSILKMSLPNIIGGLTVVAIVSIAGWTWHTYWPQRPDSSIISEPKDGDRVKHIQSLTGWYSENEEESDLWIVVQPVQSPNYHPQPGPITKDKNGTWKAVSYLGKSASENIGEEFNIFLISASPEASKRFSEYLAFSADTKKWVGLERLPNGATSLYSIRVFRE